MPELSVIIPTLNERQNLLPAVQELTAALMGVDWEVIFVDDDSRDGTSDAARRLAAENSRVRIVQRIGRRGLSSACIEGMLASSSRYLAVMDGDLQHDPAILPRMLERIKQDELDLVIGSRNVQGGSMGDFAKERVRLSNLGKQLSHMVTRVEVTDPMSGFFMLDRNFLHEVVRGLSGMGFKILLDLIASAKRPVRLAEIPFRFRSRAHGESKLDTTVSLEFLLLLADKAVGRVIPVRFALFSLVGMFGVAVHLITLGFLLQAFALPFLPSHVAATFMAMTFNFLLNNAVTYRDQRVKGWRIVPGLLGFYAACSMGALANFALTRLLSQAGLPWFVAGAIGITISSAWNFGASYVLSWRRLVHENQALSLGSGTKDPSSRLFGTGS